uniref:Poly(A) specific ribonuclease subunit PAN2 n=1 Tax=Sphaeramia orbicularis TaxID=375764 RepID=A0A672YGD5_9TELE
MNFDGLDPGMGEYSPALHGTLDGGMEPSMDPHLNPTLMQGVELDPEGLGVTVPEPVHLMEGMFSELHSAVSEVGIPVTATHFDLQEEMLWMGNHRGHVTSFFGPTMGRYSSFQVHATDDIRHIQSLETGVLFLSKIMFDYPMEEGADMHSLLMTDNNTMLMGGLQNYVVEVDLSTVQETQKFTVEVPGVAIMRQTSRFFFCGHTSGKVTLRDLRTFKMEHEFDAFSGSLSDFDVHGNLLAACGFSSRGLNGMACDRFLMVYDLRMMRAVTPLQVHVDPLFLRFIPTYTSRLIFLFFFWPFLQIIVHIVKQALAFGDSGGCVHLWSDAPEVSFNDYSRETEFPLPCLVDTLPQLDWNHDLLPLSLIPMPLTSTEQLLSDWPTALATPSPRRAPPVDPEILRTMKTVGFIGYAANPRTRPRNQVDVELDYDNYNQVPESPIGRDEEPHLYMVPKKYRKVTIKYSKLGLEDFDFKHYNRTLFAGLEPHIPNAYCNCMIQVRKCRTFRELQFSCSIFLLLCLLKASNFLRAFRTIPEASALGLILADSDEQTGKARLGRLIQSWNRFILTQLHQETQEQEGPQAYRGAKLSR